MTAPTFGQRLAEDLNEASGENARLREALRLADERNTALTKQRDDAVDELANMVDVTRQFGQIGDFLAQALADRDWHRERGDEYAERCDAYLATIDELQGEVADLKRELAWHTETTR